MNNDVFKRILRTFADNPGDIQFSKGEIVLQIRDDLIHIQMKQKDMSLYVIENGNEYIAEKWIVNRLARLPQLADRLIDYIPKEKNFVIPKGQFLDQIENNPTENLAEVDNALDCINKFLDKKTGFSSSVLYLTSDAGEGKTTLINELARKQALAYKNKETDWLLIPILLGGRPFLRFDDIVIASLVNNYRFQIFYWDSFVEMVKMGIIIPAFDGFEEMFVESSTDEALSSLGNLLNQFESSGNILIAARKAYFDYKSFTSQAKLFDTIHADSVSFSKISLKRWEKGHFLSYAGNRKIENGSGIYEVISQQLGNDHPILTRAVLVKRLLDVTEKLDNDEIRKKIGYTTHDYFSSFVDAIIEREIRDKWIDRSGEYSKTLLDISEHHKLLSMIAQEMWYTNTEYVKSDVLDLIADLFSENKKDSRISKQIRERIKHHALLISSGMNSNEFSFDHDEFRQFFLGKFLSENIINKDITETRSILRISLIPQQTAETATSTLKQRKIDIPDIIKLLQSLCIKESPVSFIRENCGILAIRLIDSLNNSDNTIVLENMAFPSDALHSRKICNVIFKKSYFKATDISHTTLSKCHFIDCIIERFTVNETSNFKNIKIKNSAIESILIGENEIFDPNGINIILSKKGFIFTDIDDKPFAETDKEYEPDRDLILTERVLRKFIRANQINENIFRLRSGKDQKYFFDNILPVLLNKKILIETGYLGGGRQRRFKLGVPMNQINDALKKSEGNFNLFIEYLGVLYR